MRFETGKIEDKISMLTLAIDDQTAKELAQLAHQRATSVDMLAAKAIRSFLRTEADQTLEREEQAFARMHAELLERFPGEYVAVREGEVVDHDADQAVLYLRITEQYPDEIVLIRQVRSEVEITYMIRRTVLLA
jgi:hypothetical protein